jgi:uncharacterized membrane protein
MTRRRRARRAEGRSAVGGGAEARDGAVGGAEARDGAVGGRGRRGTRLLGIFFVGAGVNHFAMPGAYRRIVPPGFGDPATLVTVSGFAEVAGGLGVLAPRTRRLAGLGLIALLAAVFPANLHMVRNPEEFHRIPRWALYGRLPLQPLMMWWAWRATRSD